MWQTKFEDWQRTCDSIGVAGALVKCWSISTVAFDHGLNSLLRKYKHIVSDPDEKG